MQIKSKERSRAAVKYKGGKYKSLGKILADYNAWVGNNNVLNVLIKRILEFEGRSRKHKERTETDEA